MLAFSQPVRLGDRITVGDQTGVVDEITLSYTALQTDEGRRVFVPNRDMVSSTLVNNSVADPRRLVTVELPVRLNASLAAARRLTSEAVEEVESSELLTYDVRVGTLTEKTAWLNVVAYAPPGANVPQGRQRDPRARARRLGEAGLLPAAGLAGLHVHALPGAQHAHVRRRGDLGERSQERIRRSLQGSGARRVARGGSGSTYPSGSGRRPAGAGARPPGRPRRVEMAGAEAGAPAPDRHERDVEPAELGHPLEEIGVAREVRRLRPLDDVADRLGGHARRARAPRSCSAGTTRIASEPMRMVSPISTSMTLSKRFLRSSPPRPRGRTTGELLAQLLERGQVEVVVVGVGHEDRVHAAQGPRVHRDRAPQVADTVPGGAGRLEGGRRRGRRRSSHARRTRSA